MRLCWLPARSFFHQTIYISCFIKSTLLNLEKEFLKSLSLTACLWEFWRKSQREMNFNILSQHTQPQRSLPLSMPTGNHSGFCCFWFLEPVFDKKMFCFSVQVVKIHCLNWHIRGYVLLSTMDHFFKAFHCFCFLIRKNHLTVRLESAFIYSHVSSFSPTGLYFSEESDLMN